MDAWTAAFGRLLSVEDTHTTLGSPARLDHLRAAGVLIALRKTSGELVFPAFQFVDGRPLPDLAAAHRIISEYVSCWTAAAWCVGGPHPELAMETPLAWATAARDPDRLRLVARRDATRLAR